MKENFSKDIHKEKMAGEPQWTTMEELLEVAAETVEGDKVLDRIKLLTHESLPIGWQNWKTLDLSKESLFGSEQEVNPQILNKLRYALPTVGLAQAFNPGTVDLPEKQYRDLNVSMLNWSFCRALIMSPPALVNKLKGSLGQAEIFLHAVEPVKPLCISRLQAAEKLKQQTQSEDLRGTKRLSEETDSHSDLKRSKIAALQDQMNYMFEIVLGKIQKVEQRIKKRGREESSEEEEEV
ncbi:uncharacterized protein LOC123260124 [Cotesia glomerata]|uniref:uncharacterized protein LOC123260124 n=1 Tax=Cotesia glomerata TaxID=32391 RepID=UPI001D022BC7|nr:uncharacterized protein LOC123260124 [Cotesia glomerata]